MLSGTFKKAHLTFQEYLAARMLARLVENNREGWKTEISAQGKKISVQELVSRKAWDPGWQEVILFLSGILKDPTPLLELVRKPDPDGDDECRHRLVLAVLCLPEIDEAVRRQPQHANLMGEIAEEMFSLWWNDFRQAFQEARVLAALAQANPLVSSENMPRMETRLPDHLSLLAWQVSVLPLARAEWH